MTSHNVFVLFIYPTSPSLLSYSLLRSLLYFGFCYLYTLRKNRKKCIAKCIIVQSVPTSVSYISELMRNIFCFRRFFFVYMQSRTTQLY